MYIPISANSPSLPFTVTATFIPTQLTHSSDNTIPTCQHNSSQARVLLLPLSSQTTLSSFTLKPQFGQLNKLLAVSACIVVIFRFLCDLHISNINRGKWLGRNGGQAKTHAYIHIISTYVYRYM